MSRCKEFPPLGFVWHGVSGNELLELLKIRREKAEAEEEKRKAKRMQRKSSKRKCEQYMHKEDKKRKIQDKSGFEYQHKRNSKFQELKKCTPVKSIELKQSEKQCKELLENWVPPPIESEPTEFEDLHWLFGTRVPTRPEIGPSITSEFSFSPMVAVYALPYTVLF